MTQMLTTLSQGLPKLGLTLAEDTQKQLCAFGCAVVEQNKVMNLTAITEPADIATLHFLDSAALLTLTDFKSKTVADIGTGAGFPGMRNAIPKSRFPLHGGGRLVSFPAACFSPEPGQKTRLFSAES